MPSRTSWLVRWTLVRQPSCIYQMKIRKLRNKAQFLLLDSRRASASYVSRMETLQDMRECKRWQGGSSSRENPSNIGSPTRQNCANGDKDHEKMTRDYDEFKDHKPVCRRSFKLFWPALVYFGRHVVLPSSGCERKRGYADE